MFKNYLKVAFRNIYRQKTFSFINVFGFAIGLAVCLIISIYVVDDLTYDRFHKDAENIFHMLTMDSSEADGALTYSITAGPLMANLVESVPEVEYATRLTSFGGLRISSQIKGAEAEAEPKPKDFIQALALAADSSFFDVFSFEIIKGEMDNPLSDPKGYYLTPEIAEILFGKEDPVGKPLNDPGLENAYVAGIVEAPPANSHLQFQMIVPLRIESNAVWWDSWENLALIGYFKINKNADPDEVERKIAIYASNRGLAEVFTPKIQPLLDVHLGSNHLRYDFVNFGRNDRDKVYTLIIIALLVLLIASINFVNLSSAGAARRAREVGMRKVLGGDKKHLFMQFMGESVIVTVLAMFLAIMMFEIAIPHLNDFLNKNLEFHFFDNLLISFLILIFSIFIGLLSGIYPALVISNFSSLSVLQGKFSSSTRGVLLRRILVVGQFSMSVALIISVFIVRDQINFLNKVDLGYSRENVIMFRNRDDQKGKLLKERISDLTSIDNVGVITARPGGTLIRLEVIPEGFSSDEGMMFDRLSIDEELPEVLDFKILEGKTFSKGFSAEAQEGAIINETAVKTLGWQDPIGKKLILIDENEKRIEKKIIGVLKDVNFTTTRRKVNPMVIIHHEDFIPRIVVKLKSGSETIAIDDIKRIYAEIYPENPFNFSYLDEIYNFQFDDDKSFGLNIAVFSALAILIACLGLFGLVSYTIQQKRREIAIRKVLGSTVKSIVLLLTKEFTRWVILANIPAWPIAYFAMKSWLNNFVYRTELNIFIFITSGLVALAISILTITLQTISAANTNPSEALKYE